MEPGKKPTHPLIQSQELVQDRNIIERQQGEARPHTTGLQIRVKALAHITEVISKGAHPPTLDLALVPEVITEVTVPRAEVIAKAIARRAEAQEHTDLVQDNQGVALHIDLLRHQEAPGACPGDHHPGADHQQVVDQEEEDNIFITHNKGSQKTPFFYFLYIIR